MFAVGAEQKYSQGWRCSWSVGWIWTGVRVCQVLRWCAGGGQTCWISFGSRPTNTLQDFGLLPAVWSGGVCVPDSHWWETHWSMVTTGLANLTWCTVYLAACSIATKHTAWPSQLVTYHRHLCVFFPSYLFITDKVVIIIVVASLIPAQTELGVWLIRDLHGVSSRVTEQARLALTLLAFYPTIDLVVSLTCVVSSVVML